LTDVFPQGTTLIVGDPTSVTRFYSHIPGAEYTGKDFWDYPCDTPIPPISFNVAGREFPLPSLRFARRYNALVICLGVIMQKENMPHWILGFAFMNDYYTVFNVANRQVGFATLA
jgi:hypothetical protein